MANLKDRLLYAEKQLEETQERLNLDALELESYRAQAADPDFVENLRREKQDLERENMSHRKLAAEKEKEH